MHVGIRLQSGRLNKKDDNKGRWIELVQTAQYQAATKVRYRVEQVFAQAKDKHGLERCRYLGLVRFGIQSFLTFMVVNAKRMMKLLTGITFRKQAKGRHREILIPVYASLPWA
jgi:IS5 family transposase